MSETRPSEARRSRQSKGAVSTPPTQATQGGAETPSRPDAEAGPESSPPIPASLFKQNAGSSGISPLSAPPCPPNVDLHNIPISREALARMAVAEYSIDYEIALGFTNEAGDRIEGRRSQQVRRTERRTREAASRRLPQ